MQMENRNAVEQAINLALLVAVHRRAGLDPRIRKCAAHPATAEDIKEACNNLAHFTTEDKNWMSEHLPEGRYETPEAVIRAVGW
jgi:hypothetical protein